MSTDAVKEKFALLISQGYTQSAAYREVNPKAKDWQPQTIHVRASEMMRDSKVQVSLEELKAQLVKKQKWTVQEAIERLKSVIEMSDKPSDIIAAIKELNKMHGYEAAKKIDITSDGESMRPREIIIVGKEDE